MESSTYGSDGDNNHLDKGTLFTNKTNIELELEKQVAEYIKSTKQLEADLSQRDRQIIELEKNNERQEIIIKDLLQSKSIDRSLDFGVGGIEAGIASLKTELEKIEIETRYENFLESPADTNEQDNDSQVPLLLRQISDLSSRLEAFEISSTETINALKQVASEPQPDHSSSLTISKLTEELKTLQGNYDHLVNNPPTGEADELLKQIDELTIKNNEANILTEELKAQISNGDESSGWGDPEGTSPALVSSVEQERDQLIVTVKELEHSLEVIQQKMDEQQSADSQHNHLDIASQQQNEQLSEKVSQLQNEINNSNDTSEKFTSEIDSLRQLNEKLLSKTSQQQEELCELKQQSVIQQDDDTELSDLKKINEELVAAASQQQSKFDSLKQQFEDLQTASKTKDDEDSWGSGNDNEQELTALREEKEQLLEKSTQQQSKFESLQKQLEEFQAASKPKDDEDSWGAANDNEEELTALREEKEQLLEKSSQQENDLASLQKQLDELQEASKVKDDEDSWGAANDNQEELSVLKEENEKLVAAASQQQSEFESLQKQFEEQQASTKVKDDEDSWGGANDNEEELTALREEKEQLLEKSSQQANDLASLQKQLDELQEASKVKDDEESWGAANDNEEETRTLKEENEQLSAKASQLQSDLNKLQQQFNDIQSTTKHEDDSGWGDANDNLEEVSSLREENEKKQSEISDLQQQLNSLRDLNQQLLSQASQKQSEFQELQQNYSKLSESKPQDDEDSWGAANDNQEELSVLKEENEKLVAAASQQQSEFESLQKQFKEQQASTNVKDDEDSWGGANDNEEELTALREEKEQLLEKSTQQQSEFESLQKQLEELQAGENNEKLSALQEEVDKQQSEADSLRELNQKLLTRSSQQQTDCQKLQQQLESHEERLSVLKEENEKLVAAASQQQSEFESLQKQFKEQQASTKVKDDEDSRGGANDNEEELTALREEKEQLLEKSTQQQSELNSLQKQFEELQTTSKPKDDEDSWGAANDNEEELTALREEKEQLLEESTRQQSQFVSLQEQFKELQLAASKTSTTSDNQEELSVLKEENEKLVAAASQQQSEFDSLQKKLEELQATSKPKDDEDSWGGANDNEEELTALREEKEQLLEKSTKQESEFASLKKQFEELQEASKSKEDEDSWGSGNDNEELTALREEKEQLLEKSTKQESEFASLKKQFEELQEASKSKEDEDSWGSGNDNEELTALREEKEQLLEKSTKQESEFASLQKQFEELQASDANIGEAELSVLKEENEKLVAAASQQQSEFESLQKQFKEQQASTNVKDDEDSLGGANDNEEELTALREEKEQLLEKSSQQENDLASLQKQLDELQATLKENNTKDEVITSLKDENEQLVAKVSQQQPELESLRKQFEELTLLKEEKEQTATELLSSINSKELIISQQQGDFENLKKELEDEVSTLKQQHVVLKSGNSSLESDLKSQVSSFEKLQTKFTVIKSAGKQQMELKQQEQKKVKQLEEELNQVRSSSGKMKPLEDEIFNLKNQLDASVQEIGLLSQEKSDDEAEVKILQSTQKDLRDSIATLKEQLSIKTTEIDSFLKESTDEIEKLKLKISDMESENNSLKQELLESSNSVAVKLTEMESLRKSLSDCEKSSSEQAAAYQSTQQSSDVLQSDLTAAVAAREASDAKLKILKNAGRQQIAARKQAEEERNIAQAEIQNLKKQISDNNIHGDELKCTITSLQEQLTTSRQESDNLKKQSSDATGSNEELLGHLQTMKSEKGEQQAEISSIQLKLSSATEQLIESQETIKQQLSDINVLNDNISSHQSDGAAQTSKIQTLVDEATAANKSLASLESNIETLQTESTTLKEQLSSAAENVSSLTDEITNLKSENATLTSEVSDLKDKATDAENSTESVEEVSSLKSKVEELQSENTTLTANVSNLQEQLSAVEKDEDSWGAAESASCLKEEYECLKSEADVLREQLREALLVKSNNDTAEDWKKKFLVAEELNNKLNRENETIAKQLEESHDVDEDWGAAEEKENEKVTLLKEEINTLKEQISSNGDVGELQAQVTLLKSESDAHQESLDKTNSTLTSLQTDLMESQDKNALLINEKQILTDQVSSSQQLKEEDTREIATLKEETERLNSLVSETQEYISDLQGQLSTSEDQLEEKSNVIRNMEENVSELQKKISTAAQDVEEKDSWDAADETANSEQLVALEAEITKSKETITSLESKLVGLQTELSESSEQITTLTEQNKDLEIRMASLNEELSKASNATVAPNGGDSDSTLLAERDTLKAHCSKLKEGGKQMMTERNKFRARATELEQELQDLKNKSAEQEDEWGTASDDKPCSECDKLNNQIIILNKQNEDIQHELEELKNKSEEKDDEWGDSFDEKNCSECEKLTKQIVTLELEIKRIRNELVSVSQSPHPSSGDADPNIALVLAQLGTEVEEKDHSIRQLSEKVSSVEEKNRELEKQSHELQSKFDSAQAEITVIESAKRVIADEMLELKQQRHHHDFEGKVDTSNGTSEIDMKELQQKLVELAAERDEWRGKCRDNDVEIERLRETLETQKSLSAPVDDPFNPPSDEVASLREQVTDWRDKYEEMTSRCAVLDKQNAVLQQKISSQNKAIDDIEIIEIEVEDLRADLSVSEARVKVLEERITELETIEQDLNKNNERMHMSLSEMTAQLSASDIKLTELVESKNKVQEELSIFQQNHQTEVSTQREEPQSQPASNGNRKNSDGWEVDSFELDSDENDEGILNNNNTNSDASPELLAAKEEIALLREEIIRLQESSSSLLNGADDNTNTNTDWSSHDEEELVHDSILENEVSLLKKELASAQAMAESQVCEALKYELHSDDPLISRGNQITEEWLNAASEDIKEGETASQWSDMNDLDNVKDLQLLDAEIDKLKSQNEIVAAEQRHMESATNEILQRHEQELSMDLDRSSFAEQITSNPNTQPNTDALQTKLIETKNELQHISRIASVGLRNAHHQIGTLTRSIAEEISSRESAQNAAVEAAGVTSEYEVQLASLHEKLNESQAAAHRWQSTADSQAEKFGKLQQMLQNPSETDIESQLRTQLVELEGKVSLLEPELQAKKAELARYADGSQKVNDSFCIAESRLSGIEDQQQDQDSLYNKITALENELKSSQDSKLLMEESLGGFEQQLLSKNQHIQNLESERSSSQQQNETLQTELSLKEEELSSLNRELEAATTTLATETTKCGKLRELLDNRDNNTKEYSDLQSEVVDLEGKTLSLEASLQSKTTEITSIAEQLTDTQNNEKTLQHELDTKTAEVAQWVTYHDQEAIRLNTIIDELSQKITTLEQELTNAKTRLQKEQSENQQQFGEDNNMLKSEVEKLQEDLTTVNDRLELKENAGDEWIAERRALKDTIARLEDEISQSEMKMKTLEVSQLTASSHPTATNDVSFDVIQSGNLETLHKKCESLEHKLQRSRDQISEQATQYGDQISDWQRKCSNYEAQAADNSKRCISLDSELRTSEDDRKACQQELIDSEAKHQKLSAALEATQTQLQRSKSELQTVNLQLLETRNNFESSCADVIRKTHEHRDLDAKNDVLTEEAKQLSKRFEEEDKKHNDKFESLRVHTDALKIKIAELEKEKALTCKHLSEEISLKDESTKENLNLKIALDNATRKLGDDEADLLREKLRQSIASHDELIEQNRTMMSVREQHAKEIAELSHNNSVQAAEMARLEGQLEVERTVGSSKMDQEATISINNLRNELKSTKSELNSTDKSLRETQSGLAYSKDGLQDVTIQLARERRRLIDVTEERDTAAHKYEELLTRNTATETQLASLKRDVIAMEQQVRDSEDTGKLIREELSNKLNAVESEAVTLRKNVASKNAAVDTMTAESTRLKDIIKGNDNKYSMALQQRDESSGKVRSQISKLQDSRVDDETVIARLRAELEVKDRAWNESEEHHRVHTVEYEEKLKMFDNLSKEHEQLQKQFAKMKQGNQQSDERIKSALEVERSSVQKFKKSEVVRIELEKQLRKTQTELLSSQRRTAENSEAAETVAAQNIKLKRELEIVDDQVKEAQRRNKRLTDGMQLLSQQQSSSSHHGNANVDVSRLLNRIQHLEMELDSKKNIGNGHGNGSRIRNDVQVTWFSEKLLLTAEIDSQKRKCLMLEDHIEGLQADLRDADEAVSEAQEQAREADERVRELEEELVTAVAEAINRKESQQLQLQNQHRQSSHETHHSRRRSAISFSSSSSSSSSESHGKAAQKGSNGWDELLLVEEERLTESCDGAQVAADKQLATCAKLRQALHKLRRNASNAVQHSASISESHRSTLENLAADSQQAGDVIQCLETSARKVQQRVNEALQYKEAFTSHVKALRGIKSPWTNPIGKMIIQHHRGKWCGSADALVEAMLRESEESERLMIGVLQWKDVPLMNAEAVEAAELAAPLIVDIGTHIEMGAHCEDIWPPALEEVNNSVGIQHLTTQISELKRDNERLRQRLTSIPTPVSQPVLHPICNPEIEKHFEDAVLHGFHLDAKCKFLSNIKSALTSTLLVTSKPLPSVNSWTHRFRKAVYMVIATRRLARLRTEAKERVALVRHSPLEALKLLLKERYSLFEKLQRRGGDQGSATMMLIEGLKQLKEVVSSSKHRIGEIEEQNVLDLQVESTQGTLYSESEDDLLA